MSPYNPHDRRVGKPGKPFDPKLTTVRTDGPKKLSGFDSTGGVNLDAIRHIARMASRPNTPALVAYAVAVFALGVAVGVVAVMGGWA